MKPAGMIVQGGAIRKSQSQIGAGGNRNTYATSSDCDQRWVRDLALTVRSEGQINGSHSIGGAVRSRDQEKDLRSIGDRRERLAIDRGSEGRAAIGREER